MFSSYNTVRVWIKTDVGDGIVGYSGYNTEPSIIRERWTKYLSTQWQIHVDRNWNILSLALPETGLFC
jgi:hypothetical protein